MDRSATTRSEQPPEGTAEWPSITEYWPDQQNPDAAKGATEGGEAEDADGITWIGPPAAEVDPSRRRVRLAVGGVLGAALLVVTGGVLSSVIKQAHEGDTLAEPATPAHSAGTRTAPVGPTGAATVAPAPVTPSAESASSTTATTTTTPPPELPTAATFELAAGSPSVTVQTRDLGTDLYQVAVGKGSTGTPRTIDTGSVHRLTVSHDGESVAVPLEITLNAKVHWTVRVTGGIEKNVLDFRDCALTAIELAAGASSTRLALPPAAGTLPVRITHGIHQVRIRTDNHDPVRVELRAGTGKVVLGGRVHDDVSKGDVLMNSSWNDADNRVEVITTGGVGTLSVSDDD